MISANEIHDINNLETDDIKHDFNLLQIHYYASNLISHAQYIAYINTLANIPVSVESTLLQLCLHGAVA